MWSIGETIVSAFDSLKGAEGHFVNSEKIWFDPA